VAPYELAKHALAGPSRSGPIVHVSVPLMAFFYPADRGREYVEEEELDARGKSKGDIRHTYGFGTLYIMRGSSVIKKYPARGGPKETFVGADGHTHSPIPPRTYVLGAASHYTTSSWPNSSIPWGAKIRRADDGEIQYDHGSGWQYATGAPSAPMTLACRNLFHRRYHKAPTPFQEVQLNELAKKYFDVDPDNPTGNLVSVWQRNDFGEWAFAILRDGTATGFFIHTTPEDETSPSNQKTNLSFSHGCIHMVPADRNEAKKEGYLKKGVRLTVHGFDAVGPPI